MPSLLLGRKCAQGPCVFTHQLLIHQHAAALCVAAEPELLMLPLQQCLRTPLACVLSPCLHLASNPKLEPQALACLHSLGWMQWVFKCANPVRQGGAAGGAAHAESVYPKRQALSTEVR